MGLPSRSNGELAGSNPVAVPSLVEMDRRGDNMKLSSNEFNNFCECRHVHNCYGITPYKFQFKRRPKIRLIKKIANDSSLFDKRLKTFIKEIC